jgi:general secretion pathway protein I
LRGRLDAGFTLLEVTVALAVVAIGLVAVFNAIIQMAHSTSMLRERALADWVAMNMISTIRLSGDFPDIGDTDGSVEFAGREWRWEARVSETPVADMRRMDMHVALEERPEDTVSIVTGFVARRSGSPAASIDWWGAGSPGEPGGTPDPEDPPEGEIEAPPTEPEEDPEEDPEE